MSTDGKLNEIAVAWSDPPSPVIKKAEQTRLLELKEVEMRESAKCESPHTRVIKG